MHCCIVVHTLNENVIHGFNELKDNNLKVFDYSLNYVFQGIRLFHLKHVK